MGQNPFKMTPFMWFCLAISVLLLVFNFDPVGNMLNNMFGPEAKRWTANIIITLLIIYSFFVGFVGDKK